MKKTKKGFTLVELVIVVAVMAILVAVAIPTVSAITKTAEDSVAATNAQTIESMLKLYEAENQPASGTFAWKEGNDENLQTALEEAKLGIENGKFIFNATNGTCRITKTETAFADAVAGEFKITFATDETTQALSITVDKVPTTP